MLILIVKQNIFINILPNAAKSCKFSIKKNNLINQKIERHEYKKCHILIMAFIFILALVFLGGLGAKA